MTFRKDFRSFISKKRLYLLLVSGLILVSLACSSGLTLPSLSNPTPTQGVVSIEVGVNIVYPVVTPTVILPVTATSTPIPTPTPFSLPTDTPQPSPTASPVPVAPAPTLTPIPAASPVLLSPTPTEEFVGAITLVEPEHNVTLSPKVREFEFKWKWSGRSNCDLPPEYVFELRIWPARPGFGPMPAMDAVQSRTDVFCDPTSGLYGYLVDNLKNTPGAQAVAVETASTGPFNWNVALLRIFPDVVPVAISDPRTFIIPDEYVGPYDPTRPTVTCSNFSVWLEAQALFLASGGPGQDINGLDPDGDGIACNELRP